MRGDGLPLSGTTAIVTGAAAPDGIGRATALLLAERGASVVVTDVAGDLVVGQTTRSKLDLLDDLAAAITSLGVSSVALEVDVTKPAPIHRCVALARDIPGKLGILVNNAGTTVGSGPFLDASPADWTVSFQVNLLGPAMFCQAVIPAFQAAGGGVIVNVGSTGSLGAEAGFGAYTAMKHGIIGLTKTIAAEFGEAGIRCNAVCPGYIMTDMHKEANERLARETAAPVDAVMAGRYEAVALGRAGTPDEVAETICYLAGPEASYVTGVALPIAGGLSVGL